MQFQQETVDTSYPLRYPNRIRAFLDTFNTHSGFNPQIIDDLLFAEDIPALTEVVCTILDRQHVLSGSLPPTAIGTRHAEQLVIEKLGINKGSIPTTALYIAPLYALCCDTLANFPAPIIRAELLDFIRILRSSTQWTSKTFRLALKNSKYKKFCTYLEETHYISQSDKEYRPLEHNSSSILMAKKITYLFELTFYRTFHSEVDDDEDEDEFGPVLPRSIHPITGLQQPQPFTPTLQRTNKLTTQSSLTNSSTEAIIGSITPQSTALQPPLHYTPALSLNSTQSQTILSTPAHQTPTKSPKRTTLAQGSIKSPTQSPQELSRSRTTAFSDLFAPDGSDIPLISKDFDLSSSLKEFMNWLGLHNSNILYDDLNSTIIPIFNGSYLSIARSIIGVWVKLFEAWDMTYNYRFFHMTFHFFITGNFHSKLPYDLLQFEALSYSDPAHQRYNDIQEYNNNYRQHVIQLSSELFDKNSLSTDNTPTLNQNILSSGVFNKNSMPPPHYAAMYLQLDFQQMPLLSETTLVFATQLIQSGVPVLCNLYEQHYNAMLKQSKSHILYLEDELTLLRQNPYKSSSSFYDDGLSFLLDNNVHPTPENTHSPLPSSSLTKTPIPNHVDAYQDLQKPPLPDQIEKARRDYFHIQNKLLLISLFKSYFTEYFGLHSMQYACSWHLIALYIVHLSNNDIVQIQALEDLFGIYRKTLHMWNQSLFVSILLQLGLLTTQNAYIFPSTPQIRELDGRLVQNGKLHSHHHDDAFQFPAKLYLKATMLTQTLTPYLPFERILHVLIASHQINALTYLKTHLFGTFERFTTIPTSFQSPISSIDTLSLSQSPSNDEDNNNYNENEQQIHKTKDPSLFSPGHAINPPIITSSPTLSQSPTKSHSHSKSLPSQHHILQFAPQRPGVHSLYHYTLHSLHVQTVSIDLIDTIYSTLDYPPPINSSIIDSSNNIWISIFTSQASDECCLALFRYFAVRCIPNFIMPPRPGLQQALFEKMRQQGKTPPPPFKPLASLAGCAVGVKEWWPLCQHAYNHRYSPHFSRLLSLDFIYQTFIVLQRKQLQSEYTTSIQSSQSTAATFFGTVTQFYGYNFMSCLFSHIPSTLIMTVPNIGSNEHDTSDQSGLGNDSIMSQNGSSNELSPQNSTMATLHEHCTTTPEIQRTFFVPAPAPDIVPSPSIRQSRRQTLDDDDGHESNNQHAPSQRQRSRSASVSTLMNQLSLFSLELSKNSITYSYLEKFGQEDNGDEFLGTPQLIDYSYRIPSKTALNDTQTSQIQSLLTKFVKYAFPSKTPYQSFYNTRLDMFYQFLFDLQCINGLNWLQTRYQLPSPTIQVMNGIIFNQNCTNWKDLCDIVGIYTLYKQNQHDIALLDSAENSSSIRPTLPADDLFASQYDNSDDNIANAMNSLNENWKQLKLHILSCDMPIYFTEEISTDLTQGSLRSMHQLVEFYYNAYLATNPLVYNDSDVDRIKYTPHCDELYYTLQQQSLLPVDEFTTLPCTYSKNSTIHIHHNHRLNNSDISTNSIMNRFTPPIIHDIKQSVQLYTAGSVPTYYDDIVTEEDVFTIFDYNPKTSSICAHFPWLSQTPRGPTINRKHLSLPTPNLEVLDAIDWYCTTIVQKKTQFPPYLCMLSTLLRAIISEQTISTVPMKGDPYFILLYTHLTNDYSNHLVTSLMMLLFSFVSQTNDNVYIQPMLSRNYINSFKSLLSSPVITGQRWVTYNLFLRHIQYTSALISIDYQDNDEFECLRDEYHQRMNKSIENIENVNDNGISYRKQMVASNHSFIMSDGESTTLQYVINNKLTLVLYHLVVNAIILSSQATQTDPKSIELLSAEASNIYTCSPPATPGIKPHLLGFYNILPLLNIFPIFPLYIFSLYTQWLDTATILTHCCAVEPSLPQHYLHQLFENYIEHRQTHHALPFSNSYNAHALNGGLTPPIGTMATPLFSTPGINIAGYLSSSSTPSVNSGTAGIPNKYAYYSLYTSALHPYWVLDCIDMMMHKFYQTYQQQYQMPQPFISHVDKMGQNTSLTSNLTELHDNDSIHPPGYIEMMNLLFPTHVANPQYSQKMDHLHTYLELYRAVDINHHSSSGDFFPPNNHNDSSLRPDVLLAPNINNTSSLQLNSHQTPKLLQLIPPAFQTPQQTTIKEYILYNATMRFSPLFLYQNITRITNPVLAPMIATLSQHIQWTEHIKMNIYSKNRVYDNGVQSPPTSPLFLSRQLHNVKLIPVMFMPSDSYLNGIVTMLADYYTKYNTPSPYTNNLTSLQSIRHNIIPIQPVTPKLAEIHFSSTVAQSKLLCENHDEDLHISVQHHPSVSHFTDSNINKQSPPSTPSTPVNSPPMTSLQMPVLSPLSSQPSSYQNNRPSSSQSSLQPTTIQAISQHTFNNIQFWVNYHYKRVFTTLQHETVPLWIWRDEMKQIANSILGRNDTYVKQLEFELKYGYINTNNSAKIDTAHHHDHSQHIATGNFNEPAIHPLPPNIVSTTIEGEDLTYVSQPDPSIAYELEVNNESIQINHDESAKSSSWIVPIALASAAIVGFGYFMTTQNSNKKSDIKSDSIDQHDDESTEVSPNTPTSTANNLLISLTSGLSSLGGYFASGSSSSADQ